MLAANNKGADQSARMRRLICAFVVRIWQNRFSHDVAHFSLCTFLNALVVVFTLQNGPKYKKPPTKHSPF